MRQSPTLVEHVIKSCALVDLEGACRSHATPYGTQFFHFRIHFHRKAPVLEVRTPPMGARPPLQEILDPPLLCYKTFAQIKIML